MGGWDNPPEYGGPEPTRWGIAAVVMVILVLGSLTAYALAR